MTRRRVAALMLAMLLALLAHPCVPALSHADEPAAGLRQTAAEHADEAAVEHAGCEPEATAGFGPTSPSGWPAGVAAPIGAALDTRVGRADLPDRPPSPVPRPALFLLHAALLA